MSIPKPLFLAPLALALACSQSAPPPAAPPASGPMPAVSAAPSVDAVKAAVDAADRSPEDRALDAGRKPDQMLSFFGIVPGMRVAELGAGGGYTSELLARVVGPTGKVYGQNSSFFLEKFANAPWTERLAKPALANVVRADREFDAPLPPEATNLDAVLMVLIYHDTVWLGTDREKMNRAVFAALKPGGTYGIVDHSGLPGSGITGVKTVHRIEEKTVRDEIEHAGFQFVGSADFLKNPADTRDWNDSPREAGDRRGTSDRFVLKFKKP